MNSIVINLILIQIIAVLIIDQSGFIQSIEDGLSKWLNIKKAHIPKPFSCSLCTTFWAGLIYLLVAHTLTLPYIAALLLIAVMSSVTNDLIYLLKDILTTIINLLNKLITKLN